MSKLKTIICHVCRTTTKNLKLRLELEQNNTWSKLLQTK